MKKKLAVLIIFIGSLFSFSSCDLTMSGTYTFGHYVEFSVAKDETKDALEDYFKSTIDFKETFSYTGERSDAIAFGMTKLQETAKKFEEEKIIAMLGENDWVVYAMYITGPKTEAHIGGITWSHYDSEEDKTDNTTN